MKLTVLSSHEMLEGTSTENDGEQINLQINFRDIKSRGLEYNEE